MEHELWSPEIGLAAQPSKRWIAHLDMDAFFASIEKRDNPALARQPVIVGHLLSRRGVVASADYSARSKGVRSGMAASIAEQRCPEGVFIRPRIAHYMNISAELVALMARFVGRIEQSSCDEAWLDLSRQVSTMAQAKALAQQLRRSIWQSLRLTCSVGLAPNKALAKMASKCNKPNGLFVVEPEKVLAFIDSQPLHAISGLGHVTSKRLEQLAIITMRQLRAQPIAVLIQHFGPARGRFLYDRSRGIDTSLVLPRQAAKSASVQQTMEQDLPIHTQLLQAIAQLLWRLDSRVDIARLRPEKVEMYAFSSQRQLLSSTLRHANGFACVEEIWQQAASWLPRHWAGYLVRSITVRLPQLHYPSHQQPCWQQLSLFPPEHSPGLQMPKAIDQELESAWLVG